MECICLSPWRNNIIHTLSKLGVCRSGGYWTVLYNKSSLKTFLASLLGVYCKTTHIHGHILIYLYIFIYNSELLRTQEKEKEFSGGKTVNESKIGIAMTAPDNCERTYTHTYACANVRTCVRAVIPGVHIMCHEVSQTDRKKSSIALVKKYSFAVQWTVYLTRAHDGSIALAVYGTYVHKSIC